MEETTSLETKPADVLPEVQETPPGSEMGTPAMTKAAEATWDRVIQWLIYATAFLLPIVFAPWTFEPLELTKQMVLFVLASAALIVWLLKLLVFRSWRVVKTPLDIPIWIFLLLYLLASLFSVDQVASFMGFYGSFSGNFFQILFLVVFYYLVVNNFQTYRELKKLFSIFYFSVFLAMLYIGLQFFGAYLVHFPFAKTQSFNTVGGLLTISLFAAFAVIFSLGFKGDNKSWFAIGSGLLWRILTIIAAFIVLVTINFVYAWGALLLGLLLYMVFQIGMSKASGLKELLTPLVLLIVVVALLVVQLVFPFVSLRNVYNFKLPAEVRLDYTTAMPVLKGVVTEKPILGTGPNTFLYAFSKYRDQKFNLSPFWSVRFDKAPSEAAENLVGTGFLGFLAFEILSVIFIVYGLFFLFRKKDPESWNLALTTFAGFALLWFAHWFFFFNTVLAFSMWLSLAGFMAVARIAGGERVKTYDFSFATSPRQTVSAVSGVSLGLVLVIVFLFFASAVYASDIFYRQGIAASNKAETFDQAQQDFEQAIRLNRFRPDYYLTYGEFLILRINQELAKKNPNLGQIQAWLTASINTSRAAVDLSPANWTAWERLANLYSFARPLVAGVDKFIIESLSKATEQDSKNPILWTELGQVYRLAARRLDPAILGKGPDTDNDGLSDEQERLLGSNPSDPDTNGNGVLDGTEVLSGLNPAGSGPLPDSFVNQYIKTDPQMLLKAEDAFKKAIALKEDYATSYFQLALTYGQSGKYDDAAATLEKIVQRYPSNVDLKYQLGLMYFNGGKVDLAAKQFREVIALVPNHSNAIFSLAVSDERLGLLPKALELYQRVLDLNPGVESLKAKIDQLQKQLRIPGKK